MGARISLAVLLALAPAPCPARGGDTPTWPLAVPGTGEMVGTLRRLDGRPPTDAGVGRARAACLNRPGTLSAREAREVLRLNRRDGREAYRLLNVRLAPCMLAEGFETTFCGGPGELPCPRKAD